MTVGREQNAALVALLRTSAKGERWSSITERVLNRASATEVWAEKTGSTLLPDDDLVDAYDAAVADVIAWEAAGHRMISILQDEYPARLREIHQAPPFIFVEGALVADESAIAVVGSRNASEPGLALAADLATALVARNVTVLSGLAAGIDAAAHTAALAADGRTVAVIGTGIAKTYPAANRELQREITKQGLVVSQFWPDAPPQKHNFLMRNAVMSGYGRATVVIEAGEQSGARAQARMAVEHGRPVILTEKVVNMNEWAQALVERPGVHVGRGVDEILDHIGTVLARESSVSDLVGDLLGPSR